MNTLRELNETIGRVFRSPNLRYFGGKKLGWAFAWTTEKSDGGKYWALKYRVLKNGDWKMSKAKNGKLSFNRRSGAREQAEEWYEKDKGKD